MAVIDGSGLIFGRLASHVAKRVLNGEEIFLINAEKIVLSGRPANIIEKFKNRRGAQNKATPEHSPTWSRIPHFLVKRMIRGMIPRHRAKGRLALKRLMVYTGNPNKLTNAEVPVNITWDPSKPCITIGLLCKRI